MWSEVHKYKLLWGFVQPLVDSSDLTGCAAVITEEKYTF